MTTPNDDGVELWILTENRPLPLLEDIDQHIHTLNPQLSIASVGNIESIQEHIIHGVIQLPDDPDGFDTFWSFDIMSAKSVFKQYPDILSAIGHKTKITHFSVLDDYAFLHVLCATHAILSMQDGLLAIPMDNQVITLSNQEALAFLEEEIREQHLEIDTL